MDEASRTNVKKTVNKLEKLIQITLEIKQIYWSV